MRQLSWLFLSGAVWVGCAGENPPGEIRAELQCGDAGVDVSYAQVHQQLIAPACLECHIAGGEGAPLNLATADIGYPAMVGVESVFAGRNHTLKIVDPNAPHNSSMMLKLFGGGARGFIGPKGESVGGSMPPGGVQLTTTAQKELVRNWICSGAKQ